MASCMRADELCEEDVWFDADDVLLGTGPYKTTQARPRTTKEQFQCPICFEPYMRPKSISSCLHSFCEQCLCSYICAEIKEKGNKVKPKCPICRKDFDAPRKVDEVKSWTKSLPLNHMIVSLMSEETGAKDDREICEPCKHRGMSSIAVKFCISCIESLCKQCLTIHRSGRITRSHILLEVDNVGRLPVVRDKIRQYVHCPDHLKKEIEVYCMEHRALLCSTCAVFKHKTCETVVEINTHCEQLLAENNHTDIQKDLNTMQGAVVERLDEMKKECVAIKRQVSSVKLYFDDIRKKLNETVDKHEAIFLKDAELVLSKHGSRMSESFNKWSKSLATLESTLALYEMVQQYGTQSQLFVCYHNISKQMDDYCRLLDEDQSSRSVNIQVEISNDMKNLIKDKLSFGSLNITKADMKFPEVKLSRTYTPGSEPLTRSQTEEKSNCHVSNEKEVIERTKIVTVVAPDDELSPCFCDADFFPDGRVVLADVDNNKLLILDQTYHFLFDIKLTQKPKSVKIINNNEMVVTLSYRKTLLFISCSKDFIRKIPLSLDFYPKCALPILEGKLLLVVSDTNTDDENMSLVTVTMDGNECARLEVDISKRRPLDGRHVTIDRTNGKHYRILQSCKRTKKLYCFFPNGVPVFEYQLQNPAGVDVDLAGNIYVCNHFKGEIHQLYSDGRLKSVITPGAMKRPQKLCFNVKGDTFLVTQYKSADIHIFKVHNNVH